MRKKTFSKRKIWFGLLGLAAAGSSILIATLPPILLAKETSKNDKSVARNNAFAGGIVDYPTPSYTPGVPDAIPDGSTPEILYFLPTIDSKVAAPDTGIYGNTAIRDFFTKYYSNLSFYNLLGTSNFGTDYQRAYADILKGINVPSEEEKKLALEAVKLFTDPAIVREKFNALNSIGSQQPFTQGLTITQPSQIRDVLSAEFTVNQGAPNTPITPYLVRQGLVTTNNFAYQVARINLNELRNYKSLAFSYQDKADPKYAKHDYRIVISNEHDDIKNFLDNPANSGGVGNLANLINNQNIFIRDINLSTDEAVLPAPTTSQVTRATALNDRIQITYEHDATGNGNYLSILISPDDLNVGADSISFGVDQTLSDRAALRPEVISYGILDASVSPSHARQMTALGTTYPWLTAPIDVDPATPIAPLIATGPGSEQFAARSLPIFAGSRKWAKNSSLYSGSVTANVQRLFMMQKTSITQTLQFVGDSNNFADGLNTLRFSYLLTNGFKIDPANVSVSAAAVNNNKTVSLANPILVYNKYLPITAPNVGTGVDGQYLQLDIALAAGVIQFEYDNINQDLSSERPYRIPNLVDRIFFEDPFAAGTANFTANDKTEVPIAPRPDIRNRDIELIADVVRNWAGYTNDPGNLSYIAPNTTVFNNSASNAFPATANGLANFNPRYALLFQDEGFAYTYRQFGVDKTNAIIDQGVLTGLYQFDADTVNNPFLLKKDNNGATTPVDASGRNVYEHFVNYTNALTTWLVERFGLKQDTDSLNPVDTYKLTAAAQGDGYVSKILIDRAGADGKLLARIANLIVRIWIGDTLLETDQTFLDGIFAKFNRQLPNAKIDITDRAKITGTLTEAQLFASESYKKSRQTIYYLLQPYVIKVFNRILDDEVNSFDISRTKGYAALIESFFQETTDVRQIPVDLVEKFAANDEELKPLNFVYIKKYGAEPATNGKEALRSFLNFIYVSGLQDRFLKGNDLTTFVTLSTNNWSLLDDPQLFTDATQRAKLLQLVALVATITKNIFTDPELVASSFGTVFDRYKAGQTKDVSSIKKQINGGIMSAIDYISSDAKSQVYKFYGYDIKTSFLQLLVTGKNVNTIAEEYIRRHDGTMSADDRKAVESFINEQRGYDLGSVFSFAVAQEYYNSDSFFSLLSAPKSDIEATAKDLLKENLARSVLFEIDSGNQTFQELSNVTNQTNYIVLGLGALLTAIGVLMIVISIARSMRRATVTRMIVEQIVFFVVLFAGIALIIIGALPGIF